MSRSEAKQLVIGAGGSCRSSVGRTTRYVVVGDPDILDPSGANLTGKARRALDLIAKGSELEIIGEDDFLAMVDGLPEADA